MCQRDGVICDRKGKEFLAVDVTNISDPGTMTAHGLLAIYLEIDTLRSGNPARRAVTFVKIESRIRTRRCPLEAIVVKLERENHSCKQTSAIMRD